MSPTPPSPAPARPREPLARRKLAERHAARARIAARRITPPSAEQRAFDAFARGLRSSRLRMAAAAVALVGSAALHASVYGVGAWVGEDRDPERDRKIVAEMRRREPEKKPEPPPPPPPPPPEKVAVKKPEPRRTEAPPPPPDEKPPPPPDKKPRRVVGLTLESTNAAGGGDGPGWSVGNTREGETETRATDPRVVDRTPPPAPVGTNQKASRIPTGGAKYVLPKRKRPAKPPYPEVLRTQGIEASVTVLVQLDATGKVTSVKIIKSGGFPEFDEAARRTALAEQFEPAMRDGKPIPYTLSYTYRFTLEQ